MKIHEILLHSKNSIPVNCRPLGERVIASGKSELWDVRNVQIIDVIVIHYISAVIVKPDDPFCHETILQIFCDYGVSSHFLISRRGRVIRLVPEEKKAWHCGGSIMPEPDNRIGVNDFSIGVELIATEKSGFTHSQYRSLCSLCAFIEKRYSRKFSYVGHDQIAGERAVSMELRREPKVDPGAKFDWDFFYRSLEYYRESTRCEL